MQYWLFVVVCLVIHIVINIDIFRKKPTVNLPAIKAYRVFVISILLYFIIDFLWGVFEEQKLAIPLYIDTTIYFILMGFTILAWAHYIAKYLQGRKWVTKSMLYIGNSFFLAEIILLIVNIFTPILFTVDRQTCVYTAYKARDIMLYIQIALYISLAIYSAIQAFKKSDTFRRRYMTITLHSIAMGTFIVIQVHDPYLPLYSIGCIIGSALLNAFVITDIKEEYKSALEESRNTIKQERAELKETRLIAYTDPLTKVKNRYAYVEIEEKIDDLINKGEMEDFAVVVFDLNGLKHINDTKGHDEGDLYIIRSCKVIESFFGIENLYRYGGDEFVSILKGENYKNRANLMTSFDRFIDGCLHTHQPIISSGMSAFRRGEDNTYHAVFHRADKIMYSRKEILKEHKEY